MDKQTKDLEYLRHCLLNSTISIQDCLKQIEKTLKYMTDSIKIYQKSLQRKQITDNGER